MNFLTDSILIVAILLSIFALASERLGSIIRAFAAQSLLIAFLPLIVHHGHLGLHQLVLLVVTVTIKVWLIPRLLFRAMREVAIRRVGAPLISHGASLVLAALLVALSFVISAHLPLPVTVVSQLLLPAAFSTLLLGLLLLITHSKAVTQVIGYLVVENGIYLVSICLIVEMPLLVEMGILLDVFVGVFVMGIVIFRINREFDHMDTHNLTALKD